MYKNILELKKKSLISNNIESGLESDYVTIYIFRVEKLLEEKSFFLKDNIFVYKMNRESSVDIDGDIHLKRVEFFLKDV